MNWIVLFVLFVSQVSSQYSNGTINATNVTNGTWPSANTTDISNNTNVTNSTIPSATGGQSPSPSSSSGGKPSPSPEKRANDSTSNSSSIPIVPCYNSTGNETCEMCIGPYCQVVTNDMRGMVGEFVVILVITWIVFCVIGAFIYKCLHPIAYTNVPTDEDFFDGVDDDFSVELAITRHD